MTQTGMISPTHTDTLHRFRDRRQAGVLLGERVAHLALQRPIVVGLPRGGVPVAYEVARALHAPLDVIVVRKLGLPFQPELGMGAIGEDGVQVLDPHLVQLAQVTPDEIAAVVARERAELERRVQRYRGERPMTPLQGRTVVVVDDGIATGGTARAALQVARRHGARRVVLAVPVAPPDTVRALAADADDVVVLVTPPHLQAVGQWYESFTQTTDDEVRALLAAAAAEVTGAADDPPDAPGTTYVCDDDVVVTLDGNGLGGHLTVPTGATGLVLFAHGSGSSRHSPRNQYVAEGLHRHDLATLQYDLLTRTEALERSNVFDVELLAVRLLAATRWVRRQPQCSNLAVGYFGASTGAAAALWAAAEDPSVRAVVSRGGRPDLASARLHAVTAPTLLIVGGRDEVVLQLNREAAQSLRCPHELVVVPGATHLFEEHGALDRVVELAADWFVRHL